MGLDMYLYVEEYVSRKDWSDADRDKDNQAFSDIVSSLKLADVVEPDSWTGLTVQIPVGYWRKANAIHAWIVDTFADGEDVCQQIFIPRGGMEELRTLCANVLAHPEKALELLPPQSGFFFGSTNVDEWYLQDLKYTYELLTRLLSNDKIDSFIYQASW